MFKKLKDDDVGAGGLSNTSGNQYVPAFLREWEVKADGSPPLPRIVLSVIDDFDQSPYGGDSPDMRIRMYVETSKDEGNARETAILFRMRTVYRNVNLGTASGGYLGCNIALHRTPRVPSASPNINRRAFECSVKLTA